MMALAALVESGMGRRVWGTGGEPGAWSGDVWSKHNSQFAADPYTFTHVSHGIAFYGALHLAAGGLPITARLVIAAGLESLWEVIENTDAVINRYRAATISLDYYGDSIVNSMSDVAACILGFLLASRLGGRASIAVFVVLELLLAVWIRDNLSLNVLMLLWPNETVRNWQMGLTN